MTDDICGAETSDGTPCEWKPGESCPFHDVEETPDNGRPTKLSKERQESIASQIEQGKSAESAARMNGIHPATFYNWLDRGRDEENTIYADFAERVTRAYGFGENKYFNEVWEIAKEEGDHRFLASLMKQRYPDSWGETETGVDADTVEIKISERTKETWEGITQE